MDETFPLPSDHALMVAARNGSDAAWRELRARHEAAVAAVAAADDASTPGGCRRAVDTAFEALRERILRADGALADDGAEAVRAVRPRAIAALTNGAYGPAPRGAAVEPSNAAATADELVTIASAFARVPEAWQTVLWHRWVEQAPAAQLTSLLGRSSDDVIALEHTAGRGLFEVANVVALGATPLPPAACRPIISMLGAYRRGTLPEAQRRTVDAHLTGRRAADAPGCPSCRRRLELADTFAEVVPTAVVPGVTGLTPVQYRAAIGAGGAAIGVAALAARRSERARRWARVGAVAAVAFALLAAALVIRVPFDDLDADLADLLDRTATADSGTVPAVPAVVANADGSGGDSSPSRVELVFPSAPQGAVRVSGVGPFDLSVSLSTPAPVFAGGTGTVDALLTNNDSRPVSARYLVLASDTVRFEALADGDGSCSAADGGGATCTVEIAAGQTVSMALRFAVASDGPGRLVVRTSLSDQVLDVPIDTVPGLLVGEVTRGRVVMVGGVVGPCAVSYACPAGTSNVSSAELDVAPGVAIERAFLVWEGDSAGDWSAGVGVVPPGGGAARSVASEPTAGVTVASTEGGRFRSVADVTAIVRAGGAGEYRVVRPPEADGSGDGSWRLVAVTAEPGAGRRLLVVVLPTELVTPGDPFELDVPVAGSVMPAVTAPPMRTLTVDVAADATESGVEEFAIDGTPVGAPDPFGLAAGDTAARSVRSYDREIASTEDALSLFAATTGSIRLAVVAVALDIVT